MKTMLKYGFVGVALLLAASILFVPSVRTKLGALGSVGKTVVTADKHWLPAFQCGSIVLRAEYNHAVIEKAARYVAEYGHNTQVFMSIAKMAAAADKECPLLGEVLDLAAVKTSESMSVIALAEAALKVETPEQESRWREYLVEMGQDL